MDLEWLSNHSLTINWTEFGIMKERPQFEAVPSQYHVYIILLYSCTAAFALIGNLITMLVLRSSKRTSRNLAKYLINLSAADLLMGTFSIPFTYTSFMYGQWRFKPKFCPFVLSSQFYSVFVSVYTLVAIGIDRYIAIKTPLRAKTMTDLSNIIIVTIWIVGAGLSAIPFHISNATTFTLGNETIYICRELLNDTEAKVYVVSIFSVTFLVPLIIFIYVYGSMAAVIFRRDLSNSATSMLKQQRRKIIKILIVIVITFVLCWCPLHLSNLANIFIPQTRGFQSEGELIQYVATSFAAHWIAMAHSFMNPIIYSFMSNNFCKEFMTLFAKWCQIIRMNDTKRHRILTQDSFRESTLITTVSSSVYKPEHV